MSKFDEALICFTRALEVATENGSDHKELQDIDKWKLKADKVRAKSFK
jgi:hypothetical protein